MKTLFHVHTNYSFDSNIPVEDLAERAASMNIDCVAVTDHDSIEGALALARIAPFRVIIGEEITTAQGHLIGLFLHRRIEPGRSAEWTARAIREQGGLVIAPHPFVSAFGCGLQEAAYGIAHWIDAVEVNNAQNLLSGPDRKAEAFAKQFALPSCVGADTHDINSLAPCYQWLPSFDMNPAGFKSALRSATLHRGRHPLWYFAAAAGRVVRHAMGMALPEGFGAMHQCEPAFDRCLTAAA